MPSSPFIRSDPQGDQLARLDDEVRQLRHDLEHHERLATLGTLAAGVAHEINNILTPVLAYAQIAAGAPHDRATVTKSLEKVVRGVETTAQIVQAMLGFAQSTAGDEGAEADVLDTVHAALTCIARDPSKDLVTLKLSVTGGTRVAIEPVALQQVFINLILNAITAMRGKPGELIISAVDRHDGQTVIRVRDTGPGIPQEIAGRLFEPFVSSHGRATRSAESDSRTSTRGSGRREGIGGSGLGLSICRRLIEQAGGAISVSSGEGQGATFTINLRTHVPARAKAS